MNLDEQKGHTDVKQNERDPRNLPFFFFFNSIVYAVLQKLKQTGATEE